MTRKAGCAARVRFDKEAEFVGETAAQKWRRHVLLGGAAFAILALAGIVWFWTAKRVATHAKEDRQTAVAAAEARLTTARAAVAERGLPAAELVRRLEALATVQRELANLQPAGFAARLEDVRRTEVRIDALRGALARERSADEERGARERLAAGDTEGGAARLREALKLQREINGSAQDPARDFDRELRLQRELAELTAEPMLQAVTTKAEQARAAVAATRWEDALALFREARELQDRLNREFPRTRFSDLAAIARFDAEITALTADGVEAQVREHMQRARELRLGDRTDEAVKELLAAAAAQQQLNERFARSRFVSMERLDEIETERQTLLAAEPLQAVRAKEEEARRFLRRRQIFRAQQSLREAGEAMESQRARFPKARVQDEDLRAMLTFLNLRAGDLAAIQDRCYEQLAPLGTGARALLRAEVLQEDFAKIMSANPSRNPGRTLPVDSLTWNEAEEFCRRLGWVLGWRVRLPTEAEMRVAAHGATAEGDGAGFQKVSGGLDEWLASAGGRESSTASVWSGDGKIVSAPRVERVRTRGFRVVVEVDLARLGEE